MVLASRDWPTRRCSYISEDKAVQTFQFIFFMFTIFLKFIIERKRRKLNLQYEFITRSYYYLFFAQCLIKAHLLIVKIYTKLISPWTETLMYWMLTVLILVFYFIFYTDDCSAGLSGCGKFMYQFLISIRPIHL